MTSPAPATDAHGYRTVPSQTETGMPPGVPFIIGNEAAERFSFYGMKSILALFMAKYLMTRAGLRDPMSEHEAEGYTHYFVAGVYYLPIAGALLSDGVLGKYRTILWLSIVYCFGHFALALNDTRLGLAVGLALICIGAGGIKPCVSANVGDQFGQGNKHLLSKVFGWFYFSINAGSFISTILCPFLLEDKRFGPHWAFGIPGVAMVVATIFFWLGRRKFIHIPPAGLVFLRAAFGPEGIGVSKLIFVPYQAWLLVYYYFLGGRKRYPSLDPWRGKGFLAFFRQYGIGVLGRIGIVYLFIIIFWALWDQSSGVEWTLQAAKMDLHFLGMKLGAGQVTTANAILILAYIPFVTYVLYPAIGTFFPLTPLRKIGIGLFVTALSYVPIVHAQALIDAGQHPSVWWQMLAYAIITLGEAMVSITGLEFSYTQAPNSMKSAVMALWLFAIATGNILVAQFHAWNPDVSDLRFFTGCAWTMFAAACAFVVVASFYKGRTYLQGDDTALRAEADIAAATNMPA